MSRKSVTLEPLAWTKAMLHAAKHTEKPVFGVLLGTSTGGITITDAIPLFHSNIMAPMTELGMTLAERHADKTGAQVVGLYTANRHAKDATPSAVVQQVASKVAKKYPHLCLCVLDANRVAAHATSALVLYTKSSDGGWREASPLEAAGASVAEFLAALDAKVDGVVDLDDHMEDVSKDWTCSPVGAGAKAQAD